MDEELKDDPSLPYTIFTEVPGKPQMRKLAPMVAEAKPERQPGEQFPLAGVVKQYPLG